MKADLHIHTTASDGTWDPRQLIGELGRAGIGVFAVTDHDSTANVAEAIELARGAGLKCIPGVELNSTKDGHNYHILGYGMDLESPALRELCRHNIGLLEQKDDDSIRVLIEKGENLSMEEFHRYEYDRHRGGWKALAYLIDKGICRDVNEFFQRIFTAENHLGFPEFPSVAEVVDVIHRAGGLAICAHVASDFHGAGLEECMPRMREEDLDGFECFHCNHSPENSLKLEEYCRRQGLCITGGSDCHGSFVPSRHLGVPAVEAERLRLPGLL